MSLTSYRAAPPRVKTWPHTGAENAKSGRRGAALHDRRRGLVLGRPGNDLLSRVLKHMPSALRSLTAEFEMGSGSGLLAQITGPAKDNGKPAAKRRSRTCAQGSKQGLFPIVDPRDTDHENDQADRAISTSRAQRVAALTHLAYQHHWSSSHGSQGSTRFEVGFPLRCLQRLSRPYIATLHCGWRHNSSTRGTSIPVLSY